MPDFKGYHVSFGYMGLVGIARHHWMLFATEDEYIEYRKEEYS